MLETWIKKARSNLIELISVKTDILALLGHTNTDLPAALEVTQPIHIYVCVYINMVHHVGVFLQLVYPISQQEV